MQLNSLDIPNSYWIYDITEGDKQGEYMLACY